MTVTVTRNDGGVDEYSRFGDRFIKYADGSLDVVRGGTSNARNYTADQWADVSGDERQGARKFFGRRK